MKVKVIVPFYNSHLGTCKVGDELEVLSATELSGLVEIIPEESKPVKKATEKKATKTAKQA